MNKNNSFHEFNPYLFVDINNNILSIINSEYSDSFWVEWKELFHYSYFLFHETINSQSKVCSMATTDVRIHCCDLELKHSSIEYDDTEPDENGNYESGYTKDNSI